MPQFSRLLAALLMVLALRPGAARAQSTAGYGDWQLQLPTNRPLYLADAGNRVYVGTENAFYFIDKTLNTTQTLSRRDGLSDVGVAALAYDSVGSQTVVVYRNNNVDLLGDDGRVRNLPDILRKNIQSDRTIFQAAVSGRRAYLATAFGLVVLNLDKREVSDTYSAIGPGGAGVRVYATAVAHDTLFAATSAGLQVARMADNLLDYRSWTVYQPVPVAAGAYEPYRRLAAQGAYVYATVDGGGTFVFRRAANAWQPVNAPYTFRSKQLRGSPQGLLLAGDGYGVYRRDATGAFQLLAGPAGPGDLVTDAVYSPRDKSYYVANYLAGVRRLRPGQSPETFAANGPETGLAYSVLADAHTNVVDVFSGGYSDRYQPLGFHQGFYEYAAGQWTNITSAALPAASYPDPIDVSRGVRTPDGTLYVGSYGNGLLEWKGPGQFRTFTEGTPGSPLRRTIDPNSPAYISVRVTDLAVDATGGVWLANQHRQPGLPGLFRFDPAAATWSAAPYFSGSAGSGSQNLDRLAIDDLGQVWASEARQGGNGLWAVDPAAGATRKFSTAIDPGTSAETPLADIYDLVKDRLGAIWVATAKGVAVLDDPSGAQAGTSVFRLPIVQRGDASRFPVLYSEVVKAVAVDGANRKWFGTNNGLWLFSAGGEEALLHFTTLNSPLPSNNITDVSVNDKTGEVWVATDAGVVTYRGGASVTEGAPSCAQVFPNPVRPDFAGLVGIGGLANNALVKITDVAGHLVYATTAAGGTVTWNLTDTAGRRVHSGVYLVLTSDANGQNGCVSKVAVLSK
ncbi:T9SS type A sorting domain-containing protein [Hymenobacter caeli]|uniref:PorZ N-terminal beta-propeller domain-containing protein n=1 Tax=Hymenobacter caeli TaxID=2735894 RepID=A0ABX2FUW0_9BACT|nr:T9SS type A sorting domain-containing protein [Hymenobacter caeli]NRT20613.1 hypothetical protein [Hymenobacter caeli]